jgi:acylphosphatase
MKTRRTIRVHALVQGVYFRASAQEEARTLGLTGYARNEPDGSVFLDVEGDEQAVEQFLAWCRHGPPGARVDRVESKSSVPVGYASFRVR